MCSFRAMLVVVVVLALAGCAGRRQATAPLETDEEYRSRVLALLEAEEPSKEGRGVKTTESPSRQQVPEQSLGKKEQASAPLAQNLYTTAQSRYQELQAKLRVRQATLDSLKRVVAAADQEIKRLGQQVMAARTGSRTPGAAVPQVMPKGSYQERYEAALQLARQQNLRRAITEFERLIAENPAHPLADNCQYWIGQCYYDLGQYEEAIAEFLKVFSFAATDKYDDAHLMICKSYLALGQREAARRELRSFLVHHSKSEYRATAEAMLRALAK